MLTNLDTQDLADLIDGVPDLVQSVNADGRIAFVNAAWLRRLGFRTDEVVGRSVLEFIHPDYHEHCMHAMQRLAAGEDVGIIETVYRTKSGASVHLEGRASMRFDTGGQPVSTRGIFRELPDLGLRNAALTRLREQRRLFHSVLSILRANTSRRREDFLDLVARKTAHALGVERIGVWLFDDAHATLACIHLLEGRRSIAEPAERILRSEHPEYFLAVESRIPIRADDSRLHPATKSLHERVLGRHGITATLDSPIRIGEHLAGVLRCEHVGPRDAPLQARGRRWTNDEEEFVLAVSAVLLIYLESERRRIAEHMLQQLNGELERIVEARTADLASSEKRLQHLITATPTVIYTCEPHPPYRTTFISPNIGAEFGYPPEAFTAESEFWIDRVHPSDRARTLAVMERALADGAANCEYRFRGSDGSYRRVRDQIVLLRDPDGTPVELVGSWVDVHDLRRAEDAAIAAASDLRRIIETANAPIVGADPEGRINEWNLCTEHLTGFPRSAMLGRAFADAFAAGSRDAAIRLVDSTLAGGAPENVELELVTRTDDRVLLLVNASARRDATGATNGIVAIGQDITDLRAAEQRSLRAQRLESIGTLAGGVAHDVNNALAPILLATGLLRKRHPASNDLIDIMESSAKRGASMVRQLLTFAKGVDGERKPLASGPLIGEIERFVRSTFPKQIEAHFHCASDLPAVLGDATQLHQVLLNLCVNARDAMPAGGTLRVEAIRRTVRTPELNGDRRGFDGIEPGDYVVWRVSDTGAGIAPELLDRILEPFFSTKSPDRGTGLGLSTVVGIVRSHGGHLRVHSTPGAGAAFSVYLPATDEQPAGQPSEESPAYTPADRDRLGTVLVVDDEPAVREVSRHILTELGVHALTASDGESALELLERGDSAIRAVITDLHMPRMSGLELATRIRQRHPSLSIILSSGHAAPEINGVGRESNAADTRFDAQLDKPFAIEALAEVLLPLLRRRSDSVTPRDHAPRRP